ncbi:formylglycine-generating enzyme family protein [Spirosoma pulveris]
MSINRISLVLLGVLSRLTLYAQEPTYTSPQGIEFILIQPGSMVVGKFQPTVNEGGMGGFGGPPPGQAGTSPVARPVPPRLPEADYQLARELARKDAMPGFRVTLPKAYYIGKFEVTQAQWKKVMGSNPSTFQGNRVRDDADQHPVESVTWQDAQVFIKKLNAIDKAHTYRLPTEFEWEYAARAGAEDDIAWSAIRASAVIATQTTSPVGTKQPNAWGLYDTLGNVWEWVQDFYNEKIFAEPRPPKSGKEHVLKGAPFYGDVKNATYMTHAGGPGSGYDVGFRIVMEVK